MCVDRLSPDGLPDQTFGYNGSTAIVLHSSNPQQLQRVAVASDGSIVAAGYFYNATQDVVLFRLSSSGVLDLTFGINGVATLEDLRILFRGGTFGSNDVLESMILHSDGSILISARAWVSGDNVVALVRFSASGVLDPPGSFFNFSTSSRISAAPASMFPDGSTMVAIGSTDGLSLVLTRISPDSNLDSSFGDNGIVNISSVGTALAMAVLPGRDILVLTSVGRGPSTYAVAKFSASGVLQDCSFCNTQGMPSVLVGSHGRDQARAVAVQEDGKLVVSGWSTFDPAGRRSFGTVRLLPSGRLDRTFGGGTGKVATQISDTTNANAMAIDQYGRIIVAGDNFTDFDSWCAVVRYLPSGALDASFGGTGIVSINVGLLTSATAVAVQSNGQVVASGSVYIADHYDFFVARFHTNGALDTSFGTGGYAATTIDGSRQAFGWDIAIQSDGKIVVAGTSYRQPPEDNTRDFTLVRYTSDGTLDASFGTDGVVISSLTSDFDLAQALALQNDGKILVTGYAFSRANSTRTAAIIARYMPNGTLDASFGGGGKLILPAWGSPSDVTVQKSGEIVVAGTSESNTLQVSRFTADGVVDLSFGGTGSVADSATSTGDSGAIQSDGRIVVVGSQPLSEEPSRSGFAIRRFFANGTLDDTCAAALPLDDPCDITSPSSTTTTTGGTEPPGYGTLATPSFVQWGPRLSGNGSVGSLIYQGVSTALSGDGMTMVFGGSGENGNYGAVWVFVRSPGGPWVEQTKLVGSNGIGLTVRFGTSVALSRDGATLAVGGPEDSSAAGAVWMFSRSCDHVWSEISKLTVAPSSNRVALGSSVALSDDGDVLLSGGNGAAWIFNRSEATWTEQGSLTDIGYVRSVAVSGVGTTIAVGTPYEFSRRGAVRIYVQSGDVWLLQAKLVGRNSRYSSSESAKAEQGTSVALSAYGDTVVVGAPRDGSRGSAWVFSRSGSSWTQLGDKLGGTGDSLVNGVFHNPAQGTSVAISRNGDTIAIGGPGYQDNRGAVWTFTRNGAVGWSQQSRLISEYWNAPDYKYGDPIPESRFGSSVALSGDGSVLSTGGPYDSSIPGAVWTFVRSVSGSTASWAQFGQALRGNVALGSGVYQGRSVSVSSDGRTLAMGGPGDDDGLGAVWLFARQDDGSWLQQSEKLGSAPPLTYVYRQGSVVVLSGDGKTLAFSSERTPSDRRGRTWVFLRRPNGTWTQDYQFYGDAASLALSHDGTVLVIGLPSDNSGDGSVGIQIRNNGWSETNPWQGFYQTLVGTGGVRGGSMSIGQGRAVSVSSDGNILAVGGSGHNNGIGAVWIFKRAAGGRWVQEGSPLLPAGRIGGPFFGAALSLSSDGHVLAVGGPGDDNWKGAVWIFTRSAEGSWLQYGRKICVPGTRSIGYYVSLSGNGGVLAATDSTMTYIFRPVNGTQSWVQQASSIDVEYPNSVSLSYDDTLVVGEPHTSPRFGGAWVFRTSLPYPAFSPVPASAALSPPWTNASTPCDSVVVTPTPPLGQFSGRQVGRRYYVFAADTGAVTSCELRDAGACRVLDHGPVSLTNYDDLPPFLPILTQGDVESVVYLRDWKLYSRVIDGSGPLLKLLDNVEDSSKWRAFANSDYIAAMDRGCNLYRIHRFGDDHEPRVKIGTFPDPMLPHLCLSVDWPWRGDARYMAVRAPRTHTNFGRSHYFVNFLEGTYHDDLHTIIASYDVEAFGGSFGIFQHLESDPSAAYVPIAVSERTHIYRWDGRSVTRMVNIPERYYQSRDWTVSSDGQWFVYTTGHRVYCVAVANPSDMRTITTEPVTHIRLIPGVGANSDKIVMSYSTGYKYSLYSYTAGLLDVLNDTSIGYRSPDATYWMSDDTLLFGGAFYTITITNNNNLVSKNLNWGAGSGGGDVVCRSNGIIISQNTTYEFSAFNISDPSHPLFYFPRCRGMRCNQDQSSCLCDFDRYDASEGYAASRPSGQVLNNLCQPSECPVFPPEFQATQETSNPASSNTLKVRWMLLLFLSSIPALLQ
jgi:uncharacterized delta-60 repeat protein